MGAWDTIQDVLFTYSSVRYVQVEAKCPAIIFRVLQLIVLVYVVVFSVVLEKAYQEYEPVVAETYSKLKGAADLNSSIVDANDLVIPPLMENAIFITTNVVTNHEVQNSTCPLYDAKNLSMYDCHDPVCKEGDYVQFQNYGMYTGTCLPLTLNGTKMSKCAVRGWCANVDPKTNVGELPNDPDPDDTPTSIVDGLENWSLFLRLNYAFPAFDITKNSAPKLLPGVNQWYIKEILEGAGVQWNDVKGKGAIILMNAKFECDFNPGSDDCKPTWKFSRLDKTDPNQKFSTGFNYYESQYDPANQTHRITSKRYGLKFEFNVSGRGGKFSIVNLLIALGSGLALLSVASLVTDFILSNLWSKKEHYKKIRNAELDEDDLNRNVGSLHPDEDVNDLSDDPETAAKKEALLKALPTGFYY